MSPTFLLGFHESPDLARWAMDSGQEGRAWRPCLAVFVSRAVPRTVTEGSTDIPGGGGEGSVLRWVEMRWVLLPCQGEQSLVWGPSSRGGGLAYCRLLRKGLHQFHLPLLSPLPLRGLPGVVSQEAVLETLICGQAPRLKTREPFLESELG